MSDQQVCKEEVDRALEWMDKRPEHWALSIKPGKVLATEVRFLRAALAASQERVKELDNLVAACRKLAEESYVSAAISLRPTPCALGVMNALAALTPAPARDGRKEKP